MTGFDVTIWSILLAFMQGCKKTQALSKITIHAPADAIWKAISELCAACDYLAMAVTGGQLPGAQAVQGGRREIARTSWAGQKARQ